MVNSVTIINNDTQETVDIKKDGTSCFVLDTIDWDTIDTELSSYRVPYQIGEFYNGIILGTREPEITGYVIADKKQISKAGITWEQYYRLQEESINGLKQQLEKIVTLFSNLTIRANGYNLDCRLSQPIKYSMKEEENNEVTCYFTMYFKCFNPLFYLDSTFVSLASIDGIFHFPMIIPQSEGIAFGEIQQRASIEIENSGDVDTPCIIKISAIGTVRNPRVYNVVTGEYMGFSGVTMSTGDIITINTNKGEENAIMHIQSQNKDVSLIGNRIKGSKFFQIVRGKMSYAYEVNEEDVNNVEVSIEYRQQYINLRGM